MAFLIKQHDLQPNLPFQILQPDKVTPKDLTGATSISVVMRHKGGPMLFKSICILDDVVNGLGHYDWQTGDTDVAGDFEYEFEIIWASGDPQTVPVDSYFQLTIIADIG
jgi:hypothetical protein